MSRARKEVGMDWFALLPEDVVAEILLRFPAGDLVRLKSVCKLWHRLITSSGFAESHLRRWTGRGGIVFVQSLCHLVMDPSYLSFEDSGICKLCSDFIHGIHLLADGDSKGGWVDYSILDSCDGLLLTMITMSAAQMKRKTFLLVCNPVTRWGRLLPTHDGNRYSPFDRVHIIYDRSVKRYKVVGTKTTRRQDCECHIIDLDRGKHQSTSWKELKVPPELKEARMITSVSVEGKLHFLVMIDQQLRLVRLFSLDLATEEFEAADCSPIPFSTINSWPDHFLASSGAFYHMYFTWHNELELWSLRDLHVNPIWLMRRVTVRSPPWYPPSWHKSFELASVSEDERKLVFFSQRRQTFLVHDLTSGNPTIIPITNTEDTSLVCGHRTELFWSFSVTHVNSLINWSQRS